MVLALAESVKCCVENVTHGRTLWVISAVLTLCQPLWVGGGGGLGGGGGSGAVGGGGAAGVGDVEEEGWGGFGGGGVEEAGGGRGGGGFGGILVWVVGPAGFRLIWNLPRRVL